MNDKKADKSLTETSSSSEIDVFLHKVATTPPTGSGRLVFAMDATASREPTWDRACDIQAQMFVDTQLLGGLQVQLCYYRGFNDFRSGKWHQQSAPLLQEMTAVRCLGGLTQVGRVLEHVLAEAKLRKIQALVFIGDALEENIDHLAELAGKLAILNIPAFLFQEGSNKVARRGFTRIAQLSGGAYCQLDANSPQVLKELLGAVAIFAAGGRKALENHSQSAGRAVQLLTRQLTRD